MLNREEWSKWVTHEWLSYVSHKYIQYMIVQTFQNLPRDGRNWPQESFWAVSLLEVSTIFWSDSSVFTCVQVKTRSKFQCNVPACIHQHQKPINLCQGWANLVIGLWICLIETVMVPFFNRQKADKDKLWVSRIKAESRSVLLCSDLFTPDAFSFLSMAYNAQSGIICAKCTKCTLYVQNVADWNYEKSRASKEVCYTNVCAGIP